MSDGSRSDIDYINPLHAVANLMAILPPNDEANTKLTKHKCYSAIIAAVIIFGYGFFMVDILNTGSPEDKQTMFVLNILHFTLSAAMIVVAIMISSFATTQEFKAFLAGIDEFDSHFEDHSKPIKQFIFELLLVHIVYLCIIVYDIYNATSTHEPYLYGKTIFAAIQTYYINLLVLLIYNYCRILKLRFKKLNQQLQRFLKPTAVLKKNDINAILQDSFKQSTHKKSFGSIGEARKMYNQLTYLTESFSNLFGWQTLFFFAIIAVGLLELVDAILLDYFDINGNIVFILLISSFAVMGIVVAVTCDMTTKEARRTTTVCYSLLLDIPTASTSMQDRTVREELILLAQQAVHECPRFSAAGFFTVDYTVLFGLLATVTSYVIVLIQLNER